RHLRCNRRGLANAWLIVVGEEGLVAGDVKASGRVETVLIESGGLAAAGVFLSAANGALYEDPANHPFILREDRSKMEAWKFGASFAA
ncbi:hypothetical protein HPP92_027680, partial [Vanilla planifolia]